MSPPARALPPPVSPTRRLSLVPASPVPAGGARCTDCAVRPQALFGALSDTELPRAHAVAHRSLGVGDLLYARGDPARRLFTLRRGVVRFERVTERGDRRIVRLAGPGDLIGQEALCEAAHGEDAIACTPVECCAIAADELDARLAASPALRGETMRRWQRALEASATWSSDVCAGPARRRLLTLLGILHRHAAGDDTVWLPPRDVLGDMLDIAMETASRLVSALRRDGVLEPLPGQAARVDAAALLRALADENR